MEAALRNFNSGFSGKRAVFLGEMLELGESSTMEHRNIIELVKKFSFDLIVLVGKHFRETNSIDTAFVFDSSENAADWLKNKDWSHYNILVKGSRGSKMEKVAEAITG
jgi:UDP-N-acetylmuramoyl-tripeptide--D-alanyl-D-alanine ligase